MIRRLLPLIAILGSLWLAPSPGLAQGGDDVMRLLGQGWTYLEAGNLSRAEQSFQQAFESPVGRNTAEVYYAVAAVWWERRNAMAAYMWLSDAGKAARESFTWDGGHSGEWDQRIEARRHFIEANFTVIKLRSPKRGKPLPPLADPPPVDPLLRDFTNRLSRVVEEGVQAKVAVQWVMLPNRTYWIGEKLVTLAGGQLDPSKAESWELPANRGKDRKAYAERVAAIDAGGSMARDHLGEQAESAEAQRRAEADRLAEEGRLEAERVAALDAAQAAEAVRREAELERQEAERQEAERLAAAQEHAAEQARLEEQRKAEDARAESDRQAAEQRLADEGRHEQERLAAERAESERLAAQAARQQEDRAAAEREEQERARLADQRVADQADQADQAEQTRIEQEDRDAREAEQEREQAQARQAEERRIQEGEEAQRDAEQETEEQRWADARTRAEQETELERVDEDQRREDLRSQRSASGSPHPDATEKLAGRRFFLAFGGGGSSVTRITAEGDVAEVAGSMHGEFDVAVAIGGPPPIAGVPLALTISVSYANLPVSGCAHRQTRGSALALHVAPRLAIHLEGDAWLQVRLGAHVGAAGSWPDDDTLQGCADDRHAAEDGPVYGVRLSAGGEQGRVSFSELGWSGYALVLGPDFEFGILTSPGSAPLFLGASFYIRHDQVLAVVDDGSYRFRPEGSVGVDLARVELSALDGAASMARFQFGARATLLF